MICLDDKSVSIPEKTWNNALKHIHDKKGYVPEMLSDKPIRTYINQATKVLQKAVNYGIADNVIPERMRQHLDNDTFLFSGHKVHSALEQANIKLRNEKGNIKSFDAFKLEVKGIDKAYNQTYLQAEYQFAVSSSQSAANWEKTQADGDRYNLRYKTAGDDNVRDSHRILDGITLPPSDPFWNSYYPPNGWRCRCEAIQVRKSKYETTDPDQAENAGQRATSQIGKDGANKAQIFRFNPGKQERIFPPKHPYYKVNTEIVKTELKKISSTEEFNDRLAELDNSNNWFVRGFKSIGTTSKKGVNGFTDMNGNIKLTKQRLDDCISAFNKISKNVKTTLNEDDAMSTLWHEITHNRNKKGNVHLTRMQTTYMELANEFTSRHTLPEFYKRLGGKLENVELQNDRKSTAYNNMVINYTTLLKYTKTPIEKAAKIIQEYLFEENYSDQKNGLVKALVLGNGKMPNGKNIKKIEATQLLSKCTSFNPTLFEEHLKKTIIH